MGTNASIEVKFNKKMSLVDVVDHLIDCGWAFQIEGKFRYWLNDPGIDWIEIQFNEMKRILRKFDNNRSQISVSMFYLEGDEMEDVTLTFNGADESVIVLDCGSGKKISPYFRLAIDFSWYIEKLLPNAETSSLNIERLSAVANYN